MLDLNKSNILVTGSHGHIGSYVVEWLCKLYKNCTVVCIDNGYNSNIENLSLASHYARLNRNIIINSDTSFRSYDIIDRLSLEYLFKMYKFDYVFHLASMLTLDTKQFPIRGIETNIMGFANILHMCKKYEVKKIVFSSSASVYGDPSTIPVSENHSFESCRLLYGTTKIANEHLAKTFVLEEGLDIVGLRYFNVYGERQSTKNVYTQIVPKWIQSILKGSSITIYGGGTQTMDMVHGEDVGRLNVEAMIKDTKDYMFYNIGSGIETSVYRLYELMRDELRNRNFEVDKIEVIHEEHDPNLVKRRKADVTRMHKYIGEHTISVEEGIKRVIDYYIKKEEQNLEKLMRS